MNQSAIGNPQSAILTPITFPARPVNGGPLDKAQPKSGLWYYEPKYNGWRALVHVPTGTMFNRHGERLSIEGEFERALAILKEAGNGRTLNLEPRTLNGDGDGLCVQSSKFNCSEFKVFPEALEWLDCEALDRRHEIGRGTLIVLDAVTPGDYARRQIALGIGLPKVTVLDAPERCAPASVFRPYTVESYDEKNETPGGSFGLQLWQELQEANQRLGCEFYEGVVAKRADSLYPIQLRSASRECPYWVKHRWQW